MHPGLSSKEALQKLLLELDTIRDRKRIGDSSDGLRKFSELPFHENIYCGLCASAFIALVISLLLHWNLDSFTSDACLLFILPLLPMLTFWLIRRRQTGLETRLSIRIRHLSDDIGNVYTPTTMNNETTTTEQPLVEPLQLPRRARVLVAPILLFTHQFTCSKRPEPLESWSHLRSFMHTLLTLSLVARLICIAFFILSLLIYTLLFNPILLTGSHQPTAQVIAAYKMAQLGRFIFCISGYGLSLTWFIALALISTRAQRNAQMVRVQPLGTLDGATDAINDTTVRMTSSSSSSSPSSSSSRPSSMSMASDDYAVVDHVTRPRWTFIMRLRIFWSKFFSNPDPNFEQSLLTLGAVSSVCCVDQEGILSRPTPSPEKIFFFRKRHRRHRHHHQQQHPPSTHHPHFQSNLCNHSAMNSPPDAFDLNPTARSRSGRHRLQIAMLVKSPKSSDSSHPVAVESNDHATTNSVIASPSEPRSAPFASFSSELEDHCLLTTVNHASTLSPVVLDLRTDKYWPHVPYFEKPRWTRFLSSLKPIGLSLLLNNCHTPAIGQCRTTIADQFRLRCVTCRANRERGLDCRYGPMPFCLCALAGQIGFRPGALRGFTPCGSVGLYRLSNGEQQKQRTDPLLQPNVEVGNEVEPAMVTDFLEEMRSHEDSSCPVALSSCFAAIFNDPHTLGGYQLMSQGAGDILASLCTDAWDGRDISTMLKSERDAMLDFYNRHASAAYCLGFAYTPLLEQPGFCLPVATDQSAKESILQASNTLLVRLPQDSPRPESICPGCNQSPSVIVPYSTVHLSRPSSARIPSECDLHHRHLSRGSVRGPGEADWKRGSCYTIPDSNRPAAGDRLLKQFQLRISPPIGRSNALFNSVVEDSPGEASMCDESSSPGRPCNRLSCSLADLSASRSCCAPSAEIGPLLGDEKSSLGGTKDANQTTSAKELQQILQRQIFLGLISMQYESNPLVVDTIRRLGQACIRFVYFSRENEVRSRVFAERLGLECGWNCHISLASPCHQSRSPASSNHSRQSTDKAASETIHESQEVTRRQSASQHPESMDSLHRARSTPLIHNAYTHPSVEPRPRSSMAVPGQSWRDSGRDVLAAAEQREHAFSSTSSNQCIASMAPIQPMSGCEIKNTGPPGLISTQCRLASSNSSSSSNVSQNPTDPNQTAGFRLSDYMSENKSRLPCGIERIRPHLEHVDNVPLQVSLFTDCTMDSTYEMIRILQDYDETVCTIGSCFSIDNARLLARGDVAILMRPLLPRSCDLFTDRITQSSVPTFEQKKQPIIDTNTDRPWIRRWKQFKGLVKHDTLEQEQDSSTNIPLQSKHDGVSRLSSYPFTAVPKNASDLAARLMHLFLPWALDMESQGFRVYELIHEAHASVNNLYSVLKFSFLAPLSAAVLHLLLSAIGLPTIPLVPAGVGNDTTPYSANRILLLPVEHLRTQLIPLSDIQLLRIVEEQTSWTLALLTSSRGPEQWIWLLCFVTPVLSLSLLDRRVERARPLREPPAKRGRSAVSKNYARNVTIVCLRFLPSLLVCVTSEVGHLMLAPDFEQCSTALLESLSSNRTTPAPRTENTNFHSCLLRLSILVDVVEDVVDYQLVWYLVLISFTYANFGQRIWKFRWSTNPAWCVCSSIIILLQTVYTLCRLLRWSNILSIYSGQVLSLPILGVGLAWGPILLILNELVARRERRILLTEHRLARLYFGTKLGMYSPV